MITRESFRFGALGVGTGVVAALALGKALSGLLFEVSAHDPRTFALVAAVASSVAFVSSYLPARRATKVEPATSLRSE